MPHNRHKATVDSLNHKKVAVIFVVILRLMALTETVAVSVAKAISLFNQNIVEAERGKIALVQYWAKMMLKIAVDDGFTARIQIQLARNAT